MCKTYAWLFKPCFAQMLPNFVKWERPLKFLGEISQIRIDWTVWLCSQTNMTIWYLACQNLNIICFQTLWNTNWWFYEAWVAVPGFHFELHSSTGCLGEFWAIRTLRLSCRGYIETLLETDFRLNHNPDDFGRAHWGGSLWGTGLSAAACLNCVIRALGHTVRGRRCHIL